MKLVGQEKIIPEDLKQSKQYHHQQQQQQQEPTFNFILIFLQSKETEEATISC